MSKKSASSEERNIITGKYLKWCDSWGFDPALFHGSGDDGEDPERVDRLSLGGGSFKNQERFLELLGKDGRICDQIEYLSVSSEEYIIFHLCPFEGFHKSCGYIYLFVSKQLIMHPDYKPARKALLNMWKEKSSDHTDPPAYLSDGGGIIDSTSGSARKRPKAPRLTPEWKRRIRVFIKKYAEKGSLKDYYRKHDSLPTMDVLHIAAIADFKAAEYEGTPPSPKQFETASRESRKKFITKKYADEAYR